ncbi:hypothetical protein F1188_13590 [Roseospira marina]|uniref:Chemotaxis protein CheZ n=1 Tax=Roseospira marina TaxID=140057 RepID=A0A5M6I9A3_9PROT|nr:hypothetical protein [Roseospira marina]KAA5604854.1 hypothetical protein F1188_13590 [Roseospira marina]MBB4315187.1 hypothetical protein [Roseospira marina]MBB5088187.1 hypothetical protein [Roseospira marina]
MDAALHAAVAQLESVLAEQESATNRILGLAELLMAHAPDAATRLRIEAIMETCAFQDVTGQRIRRVRGLLSRLTTLRGGPFRLGPRSSAPTSPRPTPVPARDAGDGADAGEDGEKGLTQADVDRLLHNR